MLTETKADHFQPTNLTHFQMLIWTGQLLDPDSPLYNNATLIDIPCAIETTKFRKALHRVVDDSPTMRAVFETVNGMPQQRVLPQLSFELPIHDFSSSDNPHKAIRDWSRRRSQRKLKLDECLFDTALLRSAADEYFWYINQHHLVCDAWSCTELYRRQVELYQQMLAGDGQDWHSPHEAQPPLNRPSRVAADSAATTSPVVYYGKRGLHVGSASERVPVVVANDPRSATIGRLGSAEAVRSFSKEISLFQLTLALLYSYLYRVSDQRELCVGVPFHNRLTPEAKRSLGVFIEFHPVSVELSGDETFRSLLKKVQAVTMDYLRSATSGAASSGTNASFNTILNFMHAKFSKFGETPVQAERVHTGFSDRQHHLRLHVQDMAGSGRVELHADFNCDIFDESQRKRAVAHFQHLIDAMAADLDQEIGAVNILSDEERARQLIEFNVTATKQLEPSVIKRLQETIESSRDQVALRCEDRCLTYAELDAVVDEFSARMIGAGIQPGSRVVICLQRSPDAVIAMLAALRSGMTFIPLDPTWPAVRQEYVFNNCGAACVLTTSNERVAAPSGIPRINLDQQGPREQRRYPRIDSDDLAYVLYTSGSTGRPKGVEISHGALANYVNWAAEFYTQGRRLGFPLFTHLTFDLTMTSVFVPLVSGGQIIVYPKSNRSADVALLDVLDDNRSDIIKLTPSHLRLLSDRDLRKSKVRQLIVGGEDFKLDLAQQVHRIFPEGLLIHNEYGPTEATVGCIVHTHHAESEDLGPSVPIGKPIGGMQAYLLNDHLQLVPEGVTGELYLAGAGLARGYLGQREMTDERFIPSPFTPGTRLYRTGDLARFNQDGVLEFLGRQDHQVKIRGARVELEAIESTLLQHPDVTNAVVTTYGAGSSQTAVENCRRCGLASNYPDVTFDEHRICNQCRDFDSYRERASDYFKSTEELQAVFASRLDRQNGAAESEYDCLVLLSGGKDSTYMLARLADMGLRILAFTLDNGYISDQAKANIRRVVEALGVDHRFGSTPAMNEIFVDSLKRHANVCQGCFKTIYTLSMNLALEKKIPFIATGLSRGQFFETRLTADLFKEPCDSLIQIDQTVLDARKAYHRVDDAVLKTLDVAELQKDEIFDKVQFIDFYRYCDVELDEMLAYLDERLPWVRPSDTGRSTNCLINDVGIYVHKRQRGFHNYALPYSWDVRLGHKRRDAALDELDDEIDVDQVHAILRDIGFDGDLSDTTEAVRLVAYYVGSKDIAIDDLNRHLSERLPSYMVPSRYVRLDELPLSDNGKVDLTALPDPQANAPKSSDYVAPVSELESTLSEIWSDVLHVPRVGIRDNFFDLGGDSILAIQIVARANRGGIRITPGQLFDALTIERLASVCSAAKHEIPDAPVDQRLTPIQHWFLSHDPQASDAWNQSVEIRLPDGVAAGEKLDCVRSALVQLSNYHQSLRTQISPSDCGLTTLAALSDDQLPLKVVNLSGAGSDEVDQRKHAEEAAMHRRITIGSDAMIGAVLYHVDNSDCRLLLVGNHLATDAISWQIFIGDLQEVLESRWDGTELRLAKRTPFALWSHVLHEYAVQPSTESQLSYWRSVLADSGSPLEPCDESSEVFVRDQEKLISRLDVETSMRIREEIPKSRITTHELLIAALAKTLAERSSQGELRVWVERHGREELHKTLDFSQTVGWFTALSPVKLSVSPNDVTSQLVQNVKTQLREVPDNGIGFGALRYLHPDPSVRDSLALPSANEVVFNFLGKFAADVGNQPPFAVTRPLQLYRSPTLRRMSALDVNLVLERQLRIEWGYDQNRITPVVVAQLAGAYLENVRSIVDFCLGEGMDHVSAADFPLAQLDESQLSDLANLLNQNAPGTTQDNEA